jgi:hypothetical protein
MPLVLLDRLDVLRDLLALRPREASVCERVMPSVSACFRSDATN